MTRENFEGYNMIKLNNNPYPYKDGMTIKTLMDENNFTFNRVIVRLNGKSINRDKWESLQIQDGDDVIIHHIFAGG